MPEPTIENKMLKRCARCQGIISTPAAYRYRVKYCDPCARDERRKVAHKWREENLEQAKANRERANDTKADAGNMDWYEAEKREAVAVSREKCRLEPTMAEADARDSPDQDQDQMRRLTVLERAGARDVTRRSEEV